MNVLFAFLGLPIPFLAIPVLAASESIWLLDPPYSETFFLSARDISSLVGSCAMDYSKETHADKSLHSENKNPVTAGLLGGLLGYGSGLYYSKKWVQGTAFLVIDSLFTSLVVRGITDIEDTVERRSYGTLRKLSGSEVVISGIAGLVASHAAQAIWSPLAAKNYNRALVEAYTWTNADLAPNDILIVQCEESF